jgi:hypothetical protein
MIPQDFSLGPPDEPFVTAPRWASLWRTSFVTGHERQGDAHYIQNYSIAHLEPVEGPS